MKSMTGYGRGKFENEQREYMIEIKSVNHKYKDISVKIPKTISYLEEKVKKIVSDTVTRGKIDVFISFSNNSTKGKQIKINTELAKIYIEQLKELAKETNIKEEILVTEISKFPDILLIENIENEDVIEKELIKLLKETLDQFINMRQIEANRIRKDLKQRIDIISEKIDKISNNSTGLVEEYVVKLKTRIEEILKTDVIDENRIATETVIYADKISIEEEITRLKSHIMQFNQLLECENVGKKIDFLIQEMNREINTIGSKANCIEITKEVIEVKVELENIREQIQNIE